MVEVYNNIFVSGDFHCRRGSDEMAVVHACKFPCHRNAVGYRSAPQKDHPHYLVKREEYDLYLNMIDPDEPYFMPPLFTEFLDFAGSHWDKNRNILIHCNQGQSRSPSLALLLLSKHIGDITDESYSKAKEEFLEIYPSYQPGLGIQKYLSKNWTSL